MAIRDIGHPSEYYSPKEHQRMKNYSNNLTRDLNEIDLDDKTRQKFYNTMIEYKSYILAADALSVEHNNYNVRLRELKEIYETTPDDNKADKALKEIQAIQRKQILIKEKYDYFTIKFTELENDVRDMKEIIDTKLEEEKGYDLGVDEIPKAPKKGPTRR